MEKMNNRGFLLAESLIVSTFVLTVLMFLFIQFKNLVVSHKSTYIYNTTENIYDLGSMANYLKEYVDIDDLNKKTGNGYTEVYDGSQCKPYFSNASMCGELAQAMDIEYMIYVNSDVNKVKDYFKTAPNINVKQDMIDFIQRLDSTKIENRGRLLAKFRNGNFATIAVERKYVKPVLDARKLKNVLDKRNYSNVRFVDLNSMPSGDSTAVGLGDNISSSSVLAWVSADTLYVGGRGGIYASDNLSNLFSNLTNINSVDFGVLNTDEVTNMSSIFSGCSVLTTVVFGDDFNTSHVNDISNMFNGCGNLNSVDLSKFNTENVKNMSSMFLNCTNLKEIKISDNFKTNNTENMSMMFRGCSSLESIDVSKFVTDKVKDMSGMFYDCLNLKSIDVTKFNTENVENMSGLFSGCSSLESIDVSKFVTDKVTDMSNMFSGCEKLKSLEVNNFKTDEVLNMQGMFNGCKTISTLDVSRFNTAKVTNMSNMFSNCENLISLDLSKFDTSKVNDMNSMFSLSKKLATINLKSFNTGEVTDMSNMFNGTENLTIIYASEKFKINKVENSVGMFNGCVKIVGGIGTTYNPLITDKTYAKIDEVGSFGYFTKKE